MRIELNSGGLGGIASISSMQTDIGKLLSSSGSLSRAFQIVKNFACNMNGGVGNLSSAVDQIERRISFEESRITALQDVENKSNGFISLSIETDIKVSDLVNKSKNEFYRVNSWSKPPQAEGQKQWYEKLYGYLCKAGEVVSDCLNKIKDSICKFCHTIKEKLSEYFEEFKRWWKDHTTITPIEIEDEVYDPNHPDYYGGRQHGPKNNVNVDGVITEKEKEYLDIIQKNTGRDTSKWTEQDLKDYLDASYKYDPKTGKREVDVPGLNHQGCEYQALVNTIFEYYINREDGEAEFYRKFGFSMRDENGNLNYEIVLVDLYSKHEEPNIDGLTDKAAEKIIESYMSDSGNDGNSSVTVDMKRNQHITVYNIDNYLRSGKQVIVSSQRYILYDAEGNQHPCGGHAMVITGVTEDGRYVVSSWGDKYYIDPKDVGKKISWTDSNGYHEDTVKKMSFSTLEYK